MTVVSIETTEFVLNFNSVISGDDFQENIPVPGLIPMYTSALSSFYRLQYKAIENLFMLVQYLCTKLSQFLILQAIKN